MFRNLDFTQYCSPEVHAKYASIFSGAKNAKSRREYCPLCATSSAWRLMSVARISIFQGFGNLGGSWKVIGIGDGSSPVEHPALQIRKERGLCQNFLPCNSGSTRFSSASYTAG